jgi:hypothetical protein
MPAELWASLVGASSNIAAIDYLLRYCMAAGWIDLNYQGRDLGDPNFYVCLTFAGWVRFDELQRGKVASRMGFMAMQFNVPETTEASEHCFKKAAEDAGFGLSVLTEGQGAGLIDDQLRVALRTAKFLVADVSTGNRGAYWEAGFAEGLGKHVIYACREGV